MATMFARVLGGVESLFAGSFTVNTESRRAVLACPMCGSEIHLPAGNVPDPVGKTTYRVSCSAPQCGWQDVAILEAHWEAP